jgi:hypothetical protein
MMLGEQERHICTDNAAPRQAYITLKLTKVYDIVFPVCGTLIGRYSNRDVRCHNHHRQLKASLFVSVF